MDYKNWVKKFSIISILGIFFIVFINFIIDPLWIFSHKSNFNKIQEGFDERQQKSNYVKNNGLKDIDGLLLGSSRSTFINQNDFYNMNIYNYALDSMYPFEYKGYIDFAKKIKGKDFKYIVIGADFYNTMLPKEKKFENPSFYIENTNSFIYKYKSFFSLDLLYKSLLNLKSSLFNNKLPIYYNRANIKFRPKVSEKLRINNFRNSLIRHTNAFIGSNYTKNNDYLNILSEIKADNLNTQFIVFTSPVTADLLVSMVRDANRIDEYKKWLKNLIDIFGEINHFMDINSITKNFENYPDDDHYYPHIATLLANKISKKDNENIPSDFGVILNKSNIENYLVNFEKRLLKYRIRKEGR